MQTVHAVLAGVLILAACAPPPAPETEGEEMVAMEEPAAPQTPPAAPVSGVGVVAAVDVAAGRITLAHEAIASIAWPAMTMQFRAEDPAILTGLAVGDRVAFELKSADAPSTVVAISKRR